MCQRNPTSSPGPLVIGDEVEPQISGLNATFRNFRAKSELFSVSRQKCFGIHFRSSSLDLETSNMATAAKVKHAEQELVRIGNKVHEKSKFTYFSVF